MDPRTFPTKGNLMLAKNSLALAKQGYDLMDKKRNILIRELMDLIERRKIDLDVRNARAERRVFAQKTADAPQLKLGDLTDKVILLRKADKNIR